MLYEEHENYIVRPNGELQPAIRNNLTATEVIEREKQVKAPEFDFLPDIEKIVKLMEEMANSPREDFSHRHTGERGMYEIQRILNKDD